MIELLVVASLLGILSLAIYGALSGGVRLSRQLQSEKFSNDLMLGWKGLQKDLRGQLKYSAIPFVGEEEKVSFASLVSIEEGGQPRHDEVGQIRYDHDQSCRCICRQKRTYVDLLKGTKRDCLPVFRSVADASFEFYGQEGEWGGGHLFSEWGGETPPMAVRLKVTLEGGVEKQFTTVLP
ncbi:MAG: type II secretion system protein [Deltaproteobacteria bacterium]|nr:type II secretion system protein [Deltaproteobacteria bacterium]